MTLILPSLLNQVALYWEPGALTESGRRDFSAVTPIEVRCHWTNEVKFKTTDDGMTPKSTTQVLTMVEVKKGGVLWLSSALYSEPAGTALAQVPVTVPTQQIIEVVDKHHSISVDEILWVSWI